MSTIGLVLCCVLHLFLILPILMWLAIMINIFLACLQKTEICFNKSKERPIKTCTVANRSQFVGICRRNLNIFPAVLRLQNKYLFHSSFFYSLKIDSDFFFRNISRPFHHKLRLTTINNHYIMDEKTQ